MPTHRSFLMIQCALAVALLTVLSFVSFNEIHKHGHGSCFLFATYDDDRLGLKLNTDAQPCQDWILDEAAVFICTLVLTLWFVIEAWLGYGSNMKYKTALQLLQVVLLVFMLILAVACSAVITYTLSHICSSRHQSQSRSNFACSDLYFYNSDGEPVSYHTKIKISEITSWLGAALIFSMLSSTLSSVDYHCTNGCGCLMRHLWCILSESLLLGYQQIRDKLPSAPSFTTAFADCNLLQTPTHTAHISSVQTPTPVPIAQTRPPTIAPVPIHTISSQPLTQVPSQPTTVFSRPQSELPPSSEHPWSILDKSTDCAVVMAQTATENLSIKPSAPPLLPSTEAPPSYDSVVHQVSNCTTTRHARNRAMSSPSVYLDHQRTGDELAPTPSLATPFADWVLLQTPTDMVVHPQTAIEDRSFTLPCHYTPLFGVRQVQAHIKSIQEKHNVEFTLLNQAGISTSVQSLNKTVADLFFAKTSGIRKVEDCFSDYLTPLSLRKFTWLWQNDQGGFSPYDPDINAILEAIYDASPEGFANNGDINKYEVGNYTIDFASMTQTNRQTGKNRLIKYEAVAIVWQYKNSQGNYVSHSHSHSEAIERMYINGKLVPLSIQGETFTFNFHSMVQIGTGGPISIQRKISSVIVPTAPCKLRLQVQGPSTSRLDFAIADFKKKLASFLCSKEHLVSGSSGLHSPTASAVSPTLNRTAHRPQVQGPSASKLDAAVTKKKLTRLLDNKRYMINGSNELYSPAASVVNKTLSRTVQTILLQKARHYFVSTLITPRKINLLGTQEQVDKVMLLLRQLLQRVVPCSHSQRHHSLQAFKKPSHWSPQTGDFTLVRVNIRTSEVGRLLDLFYTTLPNAQIHRIDRIQNLWLWEKYNFAKCRLAKKNHGKINEKDLFHGTGSTLPEKVFRSEHGFDFRRANQGLWGEGAYFAVNASYSDHYAHHSAGKKQMILVKVLAGNACYLSPSDSTRKLKQPPVMPSSGQSGASAVFHEERYDTVRGHSGGSDIYVVYDHDKAYPAYLITYQTT